MIDNTVVISTPPHVKSRRTTRGIMGDVCIALVPAAIAGIVFFGVKALLTELVSVFVCVATEFCYYFTANGGFAKKCSDAGKVCKKWLRQFDLTSVVTGLILALTLPPTVAWYEAAVGGIFAIAIVKMLFGGTGKNLVNPAAAARVMMFISFTITTFVACNFAPLAGEGAQVTGATNLAGLLPAEGQPKSFLTNLDLFLGTGVAGSIGETSKLAILLGFAYMCVRQVIKWWQPVLFLAVFGLASVIGLGFFYDPFTFEIELLLPSVLSGGVMFGAVFMFTDYVTSPKGVYGQILYFAAGGILVAVLRCLTRIEVTSFVILIMNILVPLIDKYMIRKPFGYVKERKAKEGK